MDNPVFIGITDTRVRDFTGEVNRVMNNYVDKFPLCAKTNGWKMEEFFNLQYYKPGGGYHMWHCERQSSSRSNTYRHMVWMTFLNDVPDGGTEWFHQDLYIPAQKGLTVIWLRTGPITIRVANQIHQIKLSQRGWYHFV